MSLDSKPLDALRLTPRRQDSIVKELAREGMFAGENRRNRQRLPWDARRQATLQVVSPAGTVSMFIVKPRNISHQGMALLHGGFVYDASECRVGLLDLAGAKVAIPGRVVRCKHVRGHVHEIGVRFDEPLELARFITTPDPTNSHDPEAQLRAELVVRLGALAHLARNETAVATLHEEVLSLLTLFRDNPAHSLK